MLYGHPDVNQHILAANRMTVNKFVSIVLWLNAEPHSMNHTIRVTSVVAATLPMNAEMCLARENGPHMNIRCDNVDDVDNDDDDDETRTEKKTRREKTRKKKHIQNRNRLVVKSIEKRAHKIASHSGKVQT